MVSGHTVLDLVLLVAALVCFLLAALDYPQPPLRRPNLLATGLALATAAFIF
jgi:hypothetical protein